MPRALGGPVPHDALPRLTHAMHAALAGGPSHRSPLVSSRLPHGVSLPCAVRLPAPASPWPWIWRIIRQHTRDECAEEGGLVMTLRRFEPGAVIVREHNWGDTAYFIEHGQVAVSKDLDGRQVHLASLGAGDTFGEMSMIDDKPRSATVTAVTATVVREIPRDTFVHSLQTDPHVALALLKVLFERLREAHTLILQLQKAAPPPTLVPTVPLTVVPPRGQLTVTL